MSIDFILLIHCPEKLIKTCLCINEEEELSESSQIMNQLFLNLGIQNKL